jgi:hypothetical protein
MKLVHIILPTAFVHMVSNLKNLQQMNVQLQSIQFPLWYHPLQCLGAESVGIVEHCKVIFLLSLSPLSLFLTYVCLYTCANPFGQVSRSHNRRFLSGAPGLFFSKDFSSVQNIPCCVNVTMPSIMKMKMKHVLCNQLSLCFQPCTHLFDVIVPWVFRNHGYSQLVG